MPIKTRVILDSNIVLKSLIGLPTTAHRKTLDNVLEGTWIGILSTSIFLEIADVLQRPEFGLDSHFVEQFLETLGNTVSWQDPTHCPIVLKDVGDQKWLNLLHATLADALITYNLKDFKPAIALGYPIMKPLEALKQLR